MKYAQEKLILRFYVDVNTMTFYCFNFRKAKELISTIINRGGPPLPAVDTNHVPDGHTIVEMMIPGPKVGLVIGKGGETIRNLQVIVFIDVQR